MTESFNVNIIYVECKMIINLSKMEGVKVFLALLISAILVIKCGHCQSVCQQSLPSQYDPTSDSSTTTSNQNTFYLYPDFFSATQCTGSITEIEYQFCYMYTRNTGRPATVFTVLILSDEGSVYRIIDSYTEREDRNMCSTMSDTCCKTVSRAVSLTIRRELAIGFVTPDTSDSLGNALYQSGTATSPGFAVSSVSVPTNVNGEISSAGFSGAREQVNNRRLSVSFAIASPMDIFTSTDDNTTSGPGENSIPGSGSNNAGAVAGGVIVCLLILAAATAIAIVLVILLLRRRRQAGQKNFDSPGSFDNQLYERQMQSSAVVGSINGNGIGLMPVGDTKGDLRDDGGSHEYAAISADDAYYEDMKGSPYLVPGATIKNNAGTSWQSQKDQSMRSMGGTSQRSRGDTNPLPLPPGAIDPYGDPFGSERGSIGSRNGTGGYTLHSRQVMSLVSKGRSESFQPADEPIYQDPAENEAALYEQYQKINVKYIQKDQISTTDVLGSGQFGVVFKGEWAMAPGVEEGGKLDVAVKTLKDGAAEEDRVKFLQEAAIIGQFSHPNVIKLHGIVIGEQKMIILELLLGGDLHHALLALNPKTEEGASVDADLPHTLLSYCRQVASGMGYLALKSFVHRDLAARNILLSEDGVCKITDFGMSRDLTDTNLYVSHGGKIPVRWTAPEAIHFRTYSTASDVWSFGCVMYEIWSLGHKPFDTYSNSDCIKLIDEGVRLPPPPGCPKTIYTLMIDCWHPDSSSRPDFVSVVQQLSLPDTKLLKWSEEDKATDPEAATLGAGLDKAVDLYKNLQERYYNDTH